MPKTGRNDPCPCGSGQKYKRCCMAKDQAAEQVILAARGAERDATKAQHRAQIKDYIASIGEPDDAEGLDAASNGVVDLIHAGRLDEAERAARELLVNYPEVPDGHDRLGMVYEARGQNREAADCYRRVVDFMRAHPGDFAPELEADALERIAKLDPPPAAD
jgi:tetratricopeptide (TPR) repeat protein